MILMRTLPVVVDWERSHGECLPENVSRRTNAWDAVAGEFDLISDLKGFLDEVDEKPELRSCAMFAALQRLRTELSRVPETEPLTSPVVVELRDAVLIARTLLQRLR